MSRSHLNPHQLFPTQLLDGRSLTFSLIPIPPSPHHDLLLLLLAPILDMMMVRAALEAAAAIRTAPAAAALAGGRRAPVPLRVRRAMGSMVVVSIHRIRGQGRGWRGRGLEGDGRARRAARCSVVLLHVVAGVHHAHGRAHGDGHGGAHAVCVRMEPDDACAHKRVEAGYFVAAGDKRGGEALVFVGEEFDLGLELREPLFLALAALEGGCGNEG